MSDLDFLSGFGNTFATEAKPGALHPVQGTPRNAPYGLVAEQINGTGFTLERQRNLRTWMYRLRPQIHDRPFEPLQTAPRWVSDFSTASASPQVRRWAPLEIPSAETDWLNGMTTVVGGGDPAVRQGVSFGGFAATADMSRVFCNIDGDLLLAPDQGTLRIRTELGWLEVSAGHIAILPRGIRFQVFVPNGPSRGFYAELYNGHFELPDRGLIGSNGLADERHFLAPVASYEDAVEETEIVVKQGGQFWRTTAPHSPFDVVAWRGRYTPYQYDLMNFMSMGSVSWDHPDPSILTVLTHPMDTHGRNAIDVGVFRGRWDPTENTFRPPYFHRNAAVEFNGVVKSPRDDIPYRAGAFSFTPYLTPHGVSNKSVASALEGNDEPVRLSDESLWLQFESTYSLKVVPELLGSEGEDGEFLSNFVYSF